ncbi:MAG: PTS sugar transporter subunit IIA [Acidobacteriota bacterium]
MVGILILTHGGLASELLASARVIAGELPSFLALPLDWGDDPDQARVKVSRALDDLDQGDGVLVLTDIFGGTPSNVALSLQDQYQIEVVAGVNLPMLVLLGCQRNRELGLSDLAEWTRAKGRRSIRSAPRSGDREPKS